jgi:hypothetical protein
MKCRSNVIKRAEFALGQIADTGSMRAARTDASLTIGRAPKREQALTLAAEVIAPPYSWRKWASGATLAGRGAKGKAS